MLLPSTWTFTEEDQALVATHLKDFLPTQIFDAHAHLYPLAATGFTLPKDQNVTHTLYQQHTRPWLGETAGALFFGLPSHPNTNTAATNRFVLKEVAKAKESKALLLARPTDDPTALESQLGPQVKGLKPYHTFATRPDTPNSRLTDYCPEWMFDLANRHSLLLMIHLVKPTALSDPENQQDLKRLLPKYKNAKVVLAHAARGFNPTHTITALKHFTKYDNLFFDTSAICESDALQAILQTQGPGRLLLGTDFPISNFRGKCISTANTFTWLHPHNCSAPLTLVGIESLLALKRATQLARLKPKAIDQIFFQNAHSLL